MDRAVKEATESMVLKDTGVFDAAVISLMGAEGEALEAYLIKVAGKVVQVSDRGARVTQVHHLLKDL